MTERSLFFNSIEGDRRRYTAQDMAEYWHSFLRSGVIHKNGTPSLGVIADGETMNILVSEGKAVIGGHLYINTGTTHTINLSGATTDRIDRVVLRLDLSRENRWIKSIVKEGTESAPPELIREGDIYEISLAQIHVKAGKSFLEQSDIIDERLNEEVCGLASSLVTVPTDEFMREWNEWFQSIKDKTYITREEFVVSQGEVKREVANLNLRLEASERIKNGVTYGTDFLTSFNMNLDDTKTFATVEVKQGDRIINVDNAENFQSGWEISIYDDTRYEEHVIESVDTTLNTIKLKTPIEQDFTNLPALARSMGIKQTSGLALGGYGKYTKVRVTNEYIGPRGTTTLNPIGGREWIISCGGTLYAKYLTSAYKRNIDTEEWEPFNVPINIAIFLSDYDRYIFYISPSNGTYAFYDTETETWTNQKTVDDVTFESSAFTGDRRCATLIDNMLLLVTRQYFRVFEVDFDNLEIRHIKSTFIPNTSEGSSGAESFFKSTEIVRYKDLWAFTLSRRLGSNLVTLKTHFVDDNFDFLKQNLDVYRPSTRYATSSMFVENNELHMYIADASTTNKLRFIHLKYNDDTSNWETINDIVYEEIDAETSSASVFDPFFIKDRENKHYLIFTNGFDVKLYQVPIRNHEVDVTGLTILSDDVRTPEIPSSTTSAQFGFLDARQSIISDDMPVLFFPYNDRQDIVLRGSFFAGTGVSIDYNVNRYTIERPNVREIAGWITHGDGIEITDVKFNGLNTFNNVTIDNTTQFAGIKFDDEQAEIKFRVNVLDHDADTNIKKILGGVD